MSPYFLGAAPASRALKVVQPRRILFSSARAFRRRALAGLFLVVAVCFAPACGVQGPPLPPRVERPEAVKDLAVIQRGQEFLLTFSVPTLATDGERLTKPLEFEIFRSVTPPRASAPATLAASTPWKNLTADDVRHLTAGSKIIDAARLSDQEFHALQGSAFTFGVRGLTRGFRQRAVEGGISNLARAILLDVSGPIENLRVRATEKAVALEWSPPAQTLAGGPPSALTGYRVYRSGSGRKGSYSLLARTVAPLYRDAEFQFGHSYYYKVQAVFEGDHTVAESEESPPVEITPRDVFPPAAPKNLTALYTGGAVELVWTASPEPDLAGYNVERREEGGDFVQVNKQLVHTPVFRDATAEPNHEYFYRVRAVDFAGNASAPSKEAEVRTW